MKLRCPNKKCEYVWDHKPKKNGRPRFYATCPRCYRKVNLEKHEVKE